LAQLRKSVHRWPGVVARRLGATLFMLIPVLVPTIALADSLVGLINTDLTGANQTTGLMDTVGIPYVEIPLGSLATTDLSQFDVVLVGSLTKDSSLNAMVANATKIAEFVALGRGLVVFRENTATASWSWVPLGGELNHTGSQDLGTDAVDILDGTHPVMQNVTDAGLSSWLYSIHSAFDPNSIAGLSSLARGTDPNVANRPVVLVGAVGPGRIVYIGLDPDRHYSVETDAVTLTGNAVRWAGAISTRPTPTVTLTATQSQTATITATPTVSNTPSATNTTTASRTPTATITRSPSASVTQTRTITNTPTITATPTTTGTATQTSTVTQTRTTTTTRTGTSTRTATSTRTSTRTSTATLTPTQTSTVTNTPTITQTPTITNTRTVTNTATNTNTPTQTATVTSTGTITQTPTITGTATVTLTATATGTFTESATPTQTATVTQTRTITGTPTGTGTHTATATVTNTATSTNSPTITNTPTVTGTPTITQTATITSTPTVTGTPTTTATPTNTPTITPTPCVPEDFSCWVLGSAGRFAVLGFQPDLNVPPAPLPARTPVTYRMRQAGTTNHICAGTIRLGPKCEIVGDVIATGGAGTAVRFRRGVTLDGGIFSGGGSLEGVECVNHIPEVDPRLSHVIITGDCDTSGANDGIDFCEQAAEAATAATQFLTGLPVDQSHDYGDVSIPRGQTLELPAVGAFPNGRTMVHMSTLKVYGTLRFKGTSRLSEVVVLVDKPLRVRTMGKIETDNTDGFDGGRILFIVTGTSAIPSVIAYSSEFNGTLIALNSPIKVHQSSTVNGALISGASIYTGYGVNLVHTPFTGQ
jgi:hypothetical protein